jgi:hypothetical protein
LSCGGAALSLGVTVSKSDPKIEINIGRQRLSGYVPLNAIDLHTSSWGDVFAQRVGCRGEQHPSR